jgi:hypothetical protein
MNTFAASPTCAAGGRQVNHAPNHQAAEGSKERHFQMEFGESANYSVTPSRLIIGSLAGNEKGDVSPTVGIKWTYLTRAADITRRGDRQQARMSPLHSRRVALHRFRHSPGHMPSLGASSLTAGASAPALFRSLFTNRRATSPMLPQVSLVAPSRCSLNQSSVALFDMSNRSTVHVGKIRKVVGA